MELATVARPRAAIADRLDRDPHRTDPGADQADHQDGAAGPELVERRRILFHTRLAALIFFHSYLNSLQGRLPQRSAANVTPAVATAPVAVLG